MLEKSDSNYDPAARLPKIIYAGAPKAGSSTVVKWLEQNPDISFGKVKEPFFYGWNYSKGVDFYERFYRDAEGKRVIIDGTVWSFGHDDVPSQFTELIGDGRVILVLRDPVERAWSNYWHNVSAGLTRMSVSFLEALRSNDNYIRTFSLYGDAMENWLSYFERHKILIVNYQELKTPLTVVRRIETFVGARPFDDYNFDVWAMPGRAPRFTWMKSALSGPDRGMKHLLSEAVRRTVRLNWRCGNLFFPVAKVGQKPPTKVRRAAIDAFFRDDIRKFDHLTGLNSREWLS